MTPEEQQERRERRDRQNINLTLYVASLLLVAAGALFIGTGLPPALRFAGVTGVAGVFYGLGLVLHARVGRLRPAAVAFAGTGLALVPVAGLALYNFAWHNGPGAWLATSLFGTAAYIFAALRLESRVLVYLSLTFVVSSAWSGVAVLGAALVWYFVAIIAVAVVFTALSLARPRWLPPVYVRPLATLHPYLVPAVAVVATLFPAPLGRAEYALVLGLCGIYFSLLSAASSGVARLRCLYGARAALTVAGAAGVWAVTGRGSDALLAAAGLLAVQSCVVAFSASRLDVWFAPGADQPDAASRPATSWWRADALLTYAGQLVATASYAVSVIFADMFSFDFHGGRLPLAAAFFVALAAAALIAARLRGVAEAAPAAALALAGIFSYQVGEAAFAVMLAVGAMYWLVRGGLADGPRRRLMVFNARAAATLVVPAVAAAATDGPAQGRAVWFSLAIAAAAQQLLSAVLERSGRRTLAPQSTLAGYLVLGATSLYSLGAVHPGRAVDAAQGAGPAWTATLVQLLAVLATGVLLLPRGGGTWRPTVGEVLPPLVAALQVAFAFQFLGLGHGNLALLMLVAYLAVAGFRLQTLQHRWSYWWLCRCAAMVLVLTAYAQLEEASGRLVVAGEALDPGVLLAAVLAIQLVFPLRAFVRGRAPRGVRADAGVVILLQLASCAATAVSGGHLSGSHLSGSRLDAGAWQFPFIIALAAVCAAVAGYVLRRVAGAAYFAPASFVVLAGLSATHALPLEALLCIDSVFAAIMVVASPGRTAKGWYFVAARVLTAALAVVFSYDVTASPTAVSVTFALVLAGQHVVRWAMRSRLADVPFQQVAVWITLAGQALLPLAYAVQHAADGYARSGDGGRWVLYVEFALLLASAVTARVLFAARGALYFGLAALLGGVLALSPVAPFGDAPVLSHTGTAAVLLLLGLAATGAGVLRLQGTKDAGARDAGTRGAGAEHRLWLVSAAAFVAAALVLSPLAAQWVPGVAVLGLAAVCFTASHVERWPALYVPAVVAVLAGALMAASAAFGDYQGAWRHYLPWLAGPGAAAAVMYGVRLVLAGKLDAPGPGDGSVRARSLAVAASLGFGAAAVAGLPGDATAWTAAAVLSLVVGIAVREAPPRVRRATAEVGAVVLAAFIQRAAIFHLDAAAGEPVWFGAPLPEGFWVAQWYVVLGAIIAGLRYLSGHTAMGRVLAAGSAGLLTLTGLGTLFGGSGAQQLWVLGSLAALLAAGLALGDRVFVRWGAAGVTACVLWAMRQYTFALLALIAVGLIAFAVWRLNRSPGGPARQGSQGSQGRPGTLP